MVMMITSTMMMMMMMIITQLIGVFTLVTRIGSYAWSSTTEIQRILRSDPIVIGSLRLSTS